MKFCKSTFLVFFLGVLAAFLIFPDVAKKAVARVTRTVYALRDIKRAGNLGELDTLALVYKTDKGLTGKKTAHYYSQVYEYFLSPIKYKAKKVFEIGISEGASLKMWEAYFPNAVIYGDDIEDKSWLNSKTIKTYVADQADRKQLQGFIDTYGADFDLILDDGGHSMEQQQVSFGYLFKYVKPGGYYIIEDVHTSLYAYYKDEYGATESGEGTTLEMIENFMRTGVIKSKHMTPEEEQYLTSELEYGTLFSRDKGWTMAGIFKKKNSP